MSEGGGFPYYSRLPAEIEYKVALDYTYEDLMNFCKSSKKLGEEICRDNAFWKQKTEYDFEDLYDIEAVERNWWETYQHYRDRFSLELIDQIREGEPFLAKALLDINNERKFFDVNRFDEYGSSALMWASRRRYGDIVRRLLEIGANSDLRDRFGWTALSVSSESGYEDIVRILLDSGAKISSIDIEGAISLGHNDVVRMLIGSGTTALIWASENGSRKFVRILLDRGANPDIQNDEGSTALIEASKRGYINIVRKLLNANAGTNPNIQNNEGNTALIETSKGGHINIVQMLLDYGANPNIQNNEGSTALIEASKRGYTTIVYFLLLPYWNADPNLRDNEEYTALDWAWEGNHSEIVNKLLETTIAQSEDVPIQPQPQPQQSWLRRTYDILNEFPREYGGL